MLSLTDVKVKGSNVKKALMEFWWRKQEWFYIPSTQMKSHLEKLRTVKEMIEQTGLHKWETFPAKFQWQPKRLGHFQKPNSRINGDLLLRDLTLIKANLAVSLSLQVDVTAVGWYENTNYSGKGRQAIVSS